MPFQIRRPISGGEEHDNGGQGKATRCYNISTPREWTIEVQQTQESEQHPEKIPFDMLAASHAGRLSL
jgi:hypothetical protein